MIHYIKEEEFVYELVKLYSFNVMKFFFDVRKRNLHFNGGMCEILFSLVSYYKDAKVIFDYVEEQKEPNFKYFPYDLFKKAIFSKPPEYPIIYLDKNGEEIPNLDEQDETYIAATEYYIEIFKCYPGMYSFETPKDRSIHFKEYFETMDLLNKRYKELFQNTSDKKMKKKEKIDIIVKKEARNSKVVENAIKRAGYSCEIDFTHKTFIHKKTKRNYFEGHHLIQMKNQEDFQYSIDVEANIIALCPNCHRKLHNGLDEDVQVMLKLLFEKRKEKLMKSGIEINMKQLFDYYN